MVSFFRFYCFIWFSSIALFAAAVQGGDLRGPVAQGGVPAERHQGVPGCPVPPWQLEHCGAAASGGLCQKLPHQNRCQTTEQLPPSPRKSTGRTRQPTEPTLGQAALPELSAGRQPVSSTSLPHQRGTGSWFHHPHPGPADLSPVPQMGGRRGAAAAPQEGPAARQRVLLAVRGPR